MWKKEQRIDLSPRERQRIKHQSSYRSRVKTWYEATERPLCLCANRLEYLWMAEVIFWTVPQSVAWDWMKRIFKISRNILTTNSLFRCVHASLSVRPWVRGFVTPSFSIEPISRILNEPVLLQSSKFIRKSLPNSFKMTNSNAWLSERTCFSEIQTWAKNSIMLFHW